MPTSKTCTSCHQDKPLDAFTKHSTSPDGRSYWCRTCRAEYERKRRAQKVAADPGYYRDRQRTYRAAQQEKAGPQCAVCLGEVAAGAVLCGTCEQALGLLEWDAARLGRAARWLGTRKEG